MFSPEKFVNVDAEFDPQSELQLHWRRMAATYELQAVLLVEVYPTEQRFEVASAFNVPAAPFNGSEKAFLLDVLQDCFKRHSAPHIHAIKNFAIAQIIRKYSRSETGIVKMWFVPVTFEGNYFVFLGFPKADSQLLLPDKFADHLSSVLFTTAAVHAYKKLSHRLQVMEMFVKEVGHDFASSVQATIATLRAIAQERIRGTAVLNKARDVEEEIMSAYRIADGLGIAVDPNYQIREPDDYDMVDVLQDVLERHRAEAEERRNRIRLESLLRSVPLWGDRKAIEVALGHLLTNAIKYSYDGAVVLMTIGKEAGQVVIRLTNSGLHLPVGPDGAKIWDFGYRGAEAKERHVNGSGIGLYTARKIISGHDGILVAMSNNDGTTTFDLRLPIDRFQAKLKL